MHRVRQLSTDANRLISNALRMYRCAIGLYKEDGVSSSCGNRQLSAIAKLCGWHNLPHSNRPTTQISKLPSDHHPMATAMACNPARVANFCRPETFAKMATTSSSSSQFQPTCKEGGLLSLASSGLHLLSRTASCRTANITPTRAAFRATARGGRTLVSAADGGSDAGATATAVGWATGSGTALPPPPGSTGNAGGGGSGTSGTAVAPPRLQSVDYSTLAACCAELLQGWVPAKVEQVGMPRQ
jgi:hypothetical protein